MGTPTRRKLTSITVTAIALASLTGTTLSAAAAARTSGGGNQLQHLPTMPVNICQNSALPRDYGTNFPTPNDPNGFGYANQTVIGWEGNYYAPFAYLSGSYFARGVPLTYQANGKGTTYCGAMYSFGVYTYGLAAGQAPAAGSVQWNEAEGYLPAMTTSFTRNNVSVSITDFANEQSIGGAPTELVYTRVQVTNHGSAAVSVPSGQSGPNLVQLDSASDIVQPGQTVRHDFVAAVDTFSTTVPLPSVAAITPASGHHGALSYGAAYENMERYWKHRLSVTPELSLPNVNLPNTNGLKNPGTSIDNAYKAAYIYTRIVQAGDAPFSAANNYAYLLNHDIPGILAAKFEQGDYTDAQGLLLNGRISEDANFDEVGANWYWDGPWRTPVAWAAYLQGTSDTAFVSKYFHDDASAASQWGPSLYTLMHTDYLAQLDATTGYLSSSFDNDSEGTWLFDDETALAGLSAYKYIATRIGNTAEAKWADGAYTSLLNAVNAGLAANEKANGFNFLPCEVNVPTTADRCAAANDANWAGSNLWGQNIWDVMLQGGVLNGILGDPAQTDNLYQTGFARLDGTGVPYPSFGAYNGYSVALNTGYTQGALYGNAHRDLPITSYAWQIASTTGGPNAWWEANGSAPNPNNPWAGSHAAPQFGAVPYAWPMAGQIQTVLQSLVAPGLESHATANGSYAYKTVLYIGRGVPDAWIVPGQRITVNNLTTSYNEKNGDRATYGVSINTGEERGAKVVHVTLGGAVPGTNAQVQLPIFADAGVQNVSGGRYDAATHTVTMYGRSARIVLGHSAKPAVAVQTASTVPGNHSQPTLQTGTQTTTTATVTNTGATTLTNVKVSLQAPSGWTVSAPAAVADIAPGKSASVAFEVTPASTANGGNALVATATYGAPDHASGSVSAEQWVIAQKPLPLPPGATDLALTATASASYTSPWTSVSAVNNGSYPIQSSDDSNLTPYWGDWPQTGSHWVELDWAAPITTNGTEVYWADDGGGLLAPSSWTVQYWTGAAWADVSNQSGQPTALDTFNQVSFDSVTTAKLRILMQSNGTASVGMIQWVVPSIP
ncbi:NEW3 domain-containing protein [Actinocrinis sp.]|uniref:NEW3 domain-containing protein n=1 Tax=Actinocrinis sp. TaxID=1920516 RepID=UPI002CC5C85D|nr:NEW3 domain-containing protein [Actinocrinis sp.]HXR74115.1 NEW3 domain-containing protein [Actinocrinis sp.]